MNNNRPISFRKKVIIYIVILIAVLLVALVSVLILTLGSDDYDDDHYPIYHCNNVNQSKLGEICSPSLMEEYRQYAISTDSNVCADTGK